MARISQLHDKFRLRYTLYLPDGRYFERSRLVTSLSVARQKRTLANELETLTAGSKYTPADLNAWTHAGLISQRDRELLSDRMPGHGKTLGECMDEWEATWSVGRGEVLSRHGRRKNLLKILGDTTPIRDLTFSHGLELVAKLRDQGCKVVYVRKHIQDLRAAFNHQVIAYRYLEHNPFATLSAGKVPPEEKIEHTILTDKQIRTVLARAEEKDRETRPQLGGTLTLHLLVLFGLGIRRKEALGLRWEHIDWQARAITLPAEITKTGKARTIGLGTRLYHAGDTGSIPVGTTK